MTIDLNAWHFDLHQVTGNMATHFNRATPEDLQKWAKALRAIAGEMETTAVNYREETGKIVVEAIEF
jgi:hypothetical protein